MTDLDRLLARAAGPGRPADDAVLDADLDRGRRALRRRRIAYATQGTFVLAVAGALLAGPMLGGSGSAGSPAGPAGPAGSSVAAPPAVTVPHMSFVAYTGEQPEGFRVATVPDGWEIQGVNEYALVIAPPDMADKSIQSFVGKLVVMLESADTHEIPDGEPIAVGDREGVVTKPGDGYGILHWNDGDGHRLVVQWPLDTGWSDGDVAGFAAGVEALRAAKEARG